MKITLPDGHKWREVKSWTSSTTEFECAKCGAIFAVDNIDNSQEFEDGDGSCED